MDAVAFLLGIPLVSLFYLTLNGRFSLPESVSPLFNIVNSILLGIALAWMGSLLGLGLFQWLQEPFYPPLWLLISMFFLLASIEFHLSTKLDYPPLFPLVTLASLASALFFSKGCFYFIANPGLVKYILEAGVGLAFLVRLITWAGEVTPTAKSPPSKIKVKEKVENRDYIQVNHRWNYKGIQNLVVKIPEQRYRSLKKQRYPAPKDPIIKKVAARLRSKAAMIASSREEIAEYITSFVQHIPYKSDGQAPRHPVKTLVDQRGNCVDKSLLLASLLKALGYQVALLRLVNHNHMAVGVSGDYSGISYLHNGNRYFYVEPTTHREIGASCYGKAQVKVEPV